MHIHYVIIYVTNMDRAVAFYRDVVGLPLAFASPDWSEFDTGGATLALHVGDDLDLPPPLLRRTGAAGRCRTGFRVSDLDAFHARMRRHGVRCVEGPTPQHGVRIAHYADPDGLVFGVSEAPAAEREGPQA